MVRVVKVPPSKDTTVITFTTTITSSAGTEYSLSTIPVKVDTIVPPPAIPSTYEGFGSQAVGGSQSAMVKLVGTKAEFEAALGSNRTIIFTKSVTFVGRYELNYSYLTIDGGGFDVTINNNNNGDGISITGHHIILTRIRVKNAGNDGINVIDGAHDVIIDHCSSYNNRDGNIDIAASNQGQTRNVTVQYCFLGDNQGSGKMLVTAQNVSIHHNLFASTTASGEGAERNPYVHANYSPTGNPNVDFRNNLIYNYGRYGSGIGYKATGNFINNYYTPVKSGAFNPAADPSGNTGSYFLSGNSGTSVTSNHVEYIISDPFKITTEDAKSAAQRVLKEAGCVRNADEIKLINAIVL